MFLRLLLLLTLVPALELVLLIEIGSRIGTLNTLLLIVATGVLGAALARAEGLSVLAQIRAQTQAGRVPAMALLEGASVLGGGLLLLTPGFVTDTLGFLMLIPPSRRAIIVAVQHRIRRWIDYQYVDFRRGGPPY